MERTTEAAGERLSQRLAEGMVIGRRAGWDWHRDATGQTCGYLSVDATGVMMQGPGGSKADGRMANVGMVYNPQPRTADEDALAKPCDGVRYLAGFRTLAELGEQLRRQAAQVGLAQVEQGIALSDASNGLEDFFDVYFSRATKIVDFRPAPEHLAPLAGT